MTECPTRCVHHAVATRMHGTIVALLAILSGVIAEDSVPLDELTLAGMLDDDDLQVISAVLSAMESERPPDDLTDDALDGFLRMLSAVRLEESMR